MKEVASSDSNIRKMQHCLTEILLNNPGLRVRIQAARYNLRDHGNQAPVVGWGNSIDTAQEVLDGYVMAAMWQDPQATSYMALSMGAMAADGTAIFESSTRVSSSRLK
jgi:ABC-type sugar transport system substrate-binding protein